jgi:cytochrome c biogenesis protein CcmG, thiol:disulfide interchange protein DsbE
MPAPERRGVDLRRLPLAVLVTAALVPVLLIGAMVAIRIAQAPGSTPTTVGSVAPDFSLETLDGDALRLGDLRGRPVIVNFWASWCLPCQEEFPLLQAAHEAHAADGLAVIGIVYQDRTQAARTFMERYGATWTAAMDPDDRVASAYNILGPPETFFIGRDGRIAARHIGQLSAASLEAKVAAIMDER